MARPPKKPGEKYSTPPRQIGRISDDVWAIIQAGQAASGLTMTDWATKVLRREAEKILEKSGK